MRALAAFVLPRAHLVWGGHPAITPIIAHVARAVGTKASEHVTLYQSAYFEGRFPEENAEFGRVIKTEARPNQNESLSVMRGEMIGAHPFRAAFFIGGMEGIEREALIFREMHPAAPMYPVASTGGASALLDSSIQLNISPQIADRLAHSYAYASLFGDITDAITET